MNKLIISILLLLFVGCSDKPVKWVTTGTTVEATKYRLEISDTSKILTENNGSYTLLSPHDSLVISRFSINYTSVNSKAIEYFRPKANQQVTNSLTPNVTEYYQFKDGNVLLLGYSTGDSLKPYTIFEPALIISPKEIKGKVESSGAMKKFMAEEKTFDDGYNTKLKIKELKQINLTTSVNRTKLEPSQSKLCSLRELVLSRDVTIAYGENNLIMPEAIIFKTKLLIDKNGFPIAEWSIKTEKKEPNRKIEEETESIEKNNPERNIFVEYITYNKVTKLKNNCKYPK